MWQHGIEGAVRVLLLLGLLLAGPALPQAFGQTVAGDEQSLLRAVRAAVANEADRKAFQTVVGNYDRYKELVAQGKVGRADAEVFDNQLWQKRLDTWDKVKAIHGDGLERVDTVGSGGRRLEPGSSYKVGVSDLDDIPRGKLAAAAAEDYQRLLRIELGGVDPRKVGLNALSPVDPRSPSSLLEAQYHPEKYPTPERMKALDYQQYESGMTTVWENGRTRRVSVKQLYAERGLAPPPKPTALDAFGCVAAEQKFLNQSVMKGLTGAEKAIYEAKYHSRALGAATELGGVELSASQRAIYDEMQAIAGNKGVSQALAKRIAANGGNVEAAVAGYLRESEALGKEITRTTFQRHVRLLAEGKAAGGAAAEAAAEASRNTRYGLAALSDRQARDLLGVARVKDVEGVAGSASRLRVQAAIEGERAAIDASKVSGFYRNLGSELKLSAAEAAALERDLRLLSLSPQGGKLLNSMSEALRNRPVSSGLMAAAIYGQIKDVATTAGEQGLVAGGELAAGYAADWYLISASPAYAAARLTDFGARLAIDGAKLGMDWAVLGAVKERAAKLAYEGDEGFLAHQGFGPGNLARRYSTEAEALKAAQDWYREFMVRKGEYVDKQEVREAFEGQVKADYQYSRLMGMVRDYTIDESTGQYGPESFFRQVGGGVLTFETFAQRFGTREKAEQAIDYYLRVKWTYDWEKHGGEPGQRDAFQELVRKQLLALWEASDKYNAEVQEERAAARGVLAEREQPALEAAEDRVRSGELAIDAAWLETKPLSDLLAESARRAAERMAERLDEKAKEPPPSATPQTGHAATPAEVVEDPSKKKQREEALKKLEERAAEVAEKGLATETDKEREEAAQFVIPDNCAIEIVGWGWDKDNPKKPGPPAVYEIRNGRIEIDEGPKEDSPALKDLTFERQQRMVIRKLRATVQGNVISGTDEHYNPPYQDWGWSGNTIENRRYKLIFQREHTTTITYDFRYVLYADGTLSWTTNLRDRVKIRWLVGTHENNQTELNRSSQQHCSGGGVWQLRKE